MAVILHKDACLSHKHSYRSQLKHFKSFKQNLKVSFSQGRTIEKNCFPYSSLKTKSIRTYSAPKVNFKKKHNQKNQTKTPTKIQP